MSEHPERNREASPDHEARSGGGAPKDSTLAQPAVWEAIPWGVACFAFTVPAEAIGNFLVGVSNVF